jgi:preprotein translocase subunit SecA
MRRKLPDRVLRTLDEKWDAVARRVCEVKAQGRPVLIGTRSVDASEALSRRLAGEGIKHVVLNAAQDRHEAEIIAMAGQAGRVTVATNMAGRGVDIRLGEGIAARGGLHVILTERHEAARIDRQLAGRCGRQGDPGTFEAIVSLEDPILELLGSPLGRLVGWILWRRWPLSAWIAGSALRVAQRRAERLHSRTRRALTRHDYHLGVLLGFAGEQE